ncbi:LacI family DNA-binding transcriptional regulator [Catenovulum maritimum]|uniref:LacI family transcriptional regulator n=1 Tax=Catenovulum maritimum TaxID=1513271 RepID=A0A0J8GUM0_9ALTE|nr:LacI family DNA-binding transcriptional regulator [Catenovulum maritimum]KMT66475.1 LacI family transcriptional regulator [Catenovulum maritimum]
MKSKATSLDIAYKAGVSQSTVSRALRNSPLVNEETRNKIQQLAKELNYKVDKNASNLRSQQTGTLALLLFEDPTSDESMINPFFLSILGCITRAAAKSGYDLLVSFQQLSEDWHADYEDASKADGIILLGYGDYVDYEAKLTQLNEQGTHFVRYGTIVEGQPGSSFGCDNFEGGYVITKHLIDKGFKHFAFLGDSSEHSPEFRDRYLGHCKALTDHGLDIIAENQVHAISTEDSGWDAAMKLVRNNARIDAVFGASDMIAVGALRAFQKVGMKVPEDLAIVGFDDIPVSHLTTPQLTTMQQNTKLAGEMLVEALIKKIHKIDVDSALIPAKLIVRQSCGGVN